MPKTSCASAKTLKICAQIGVCIFNEGSLTLLKIMEAMGVEIGTHDYNFAIKRDSKLICHSNNEIKAATKEARMAKKQALQEQEEAYLDLERLLYGPGIDD